MGGVNKRLRASLGAGASVGWNILFQKGFPLHPVRRPQGGSIRSTFSMNSGSGARSRWQAWRSGRGWLIVMTALATAVPRDAASASGNHQRATGRHVPAASVLYWQGGEGKPPKDWIL